MSTQNEYKPIEYYQKNKSHIIDEVNEFMGQLFPEKELCDYMWEHLASTLVGVNEYQTFNIYTGSGANGKSKLVELMQKVLGDYKGTIPSALITQKRNNIGSTSSEVHQLIGKRYAVMNEPSKGDTINEGIMKEITGGDPIQCRALFKDSVTFVPQFKLAVCTNVLYDIKSNDDGTWRRIRVCEFKSKFTDKPTESCYTEAKNHRSVQYSNVTQQKDHILSALSEGNVIAFGFTVFESFEKGSVKDDGIMTMPKDTEKSLGGHAVAIVGLSLIHI